MNNGKLYVLVRNDLSPGYQATQAMHAALDFSVQHPDIVREWNFHSNTLVVLAVPNEDRLLDFAKTAESWGVAHTLFLEPDIGHEATALAIQPSPVTSTICAKLPLALKSAVLAPSGSGGPKSL
jgi:peptidyl-tRNA hydrolase